MAAAVLVCISLHFVAIHSFLMHDDWFIVNTFHAGIGETLGDIADTSILSCGTACSRHRECTAANYAPNNNTCTLLLVHNVTVDWKEDEFITFIWMNGIKRRLGKQ